jgi:hypothetical protein
MNVIYPGEKWMKRSIRGIKKGGDHDPWDHRLSMGGGGWDVKDYGNFIISISITFRRKKK